MTGYSLANWRHILGSKLIPNGKLNFGVCISVIFHSENLKEEVWYTLNMHGDIETEWL